jgi:hypothetical protein
MVVGSTLSSIPVSHTTHPQRRRSTATAPIQTSSGSPSWKRPTPSSTAATRPSSTVKKEEKKKIKTEKAKKGSSMADLEKMILAKRETGFKGFLNYMESKYGGEEEELETKKNKRVKK